MSSDEKLQRWLDLIAFLAPRRRPVPLEMIAGGVPGYASKLAAGTGAALANVRRTFHRDRSELEELGIHVRSDPLPGQMPNEPREGYRLDRKELYLPFVRLLGRVTSGAPARDTGGRGTPCSLPVGTLEISEEDAEAALEGLLHLAELPDFPFAADARSAYRKLTFDLDPERFRWTPVEILPPPGAPEVAGALRLLADARTRRRRVSFRYHGALRGTPTDRDVAPYGLVFEHGAWYLVGHDSLRDAIRTFRVSRMEGLEVNGRKAHTPDYEVAADFRLGDHAGLRPWELGSDEDTRRPVRVLFHHPRSLWAARNGFGTLVEDRPDGAQARELRVRDRDTLLRWILSLQGEAEILLPAELKDELRRTAGAVARRHRVRRAARGRGGRRA